MPGITKRRILVGLNNKKLQFLKTGVWKSELWLSLRPYCLYPIREFVLPSPSFGGIVPLLDIPCLIAYYSDHRFGPERTGMCISVFLCLYFHKGRNCIVVGTNLLPYGLI